VKQFIWPAALVGVLLFAVAAGAQAPAAADAPDGTSLTAEAYTFEDLLQQAQRNNRDYRMALAREQAARAQWWQAVLAFGPTASLQAGYVLDNKPMFMSLDLGGFTQQIEVAPSYYSGQLMISQPLFTGFKLLSGLHLAELQHETAQAESALARNRLYLDLTRSFYGVMVTERLVAVMEESLAQMQQHLAVVKARYREGSASNYDLLRSEVQVANLQPNLLKTRNALVLARKNLENLTGLDGSRPYRLQGSLEIIEEQWPPLPQMQQLALERRQELRNLERAKRMAEVSHTLAWSSNFPNLALNGSWSYYDYQDQGFPPEAANLQHSWQITLGLNWTFWDNLAAWPKTEAAAARVREAELGRQALEEGIRIEVESAYLDLMAAQESVGVQRKNTELAQEGYRIAEEQYAHGLMANLDVLDAQLALNQAQTNYLQAQLDYMVARIKLRQAIGESL